MRATPTRMEAKFANELLRGETLLWTGRPGPPLFSPADALLVPFSLFWGGFAIFWEVGVLGSGKAGGQPPPFPFALFGVPFVLLGLYFVFGRFFYKVWRNKRTYYAVTNERVLVLVEGPIRKVRAVFIRNVPTIAKRVGTGGRGTLRFGVASGFGGLATMYENSGMEFLAWSAGELPPAFFDVPDAERVYQLVLEQGREAR